MTRFKFKDPFPDELKSQFIIVEDFQNGKVLVKEVEVCRDWFIKPTQILNLTDLIEIKESDPI